MMQTKAAAVAIVNGVLMFAGEYRMMPTEGASLRLEVEKTGLLRGKKHLFDFSGYRGTVAFDPASPLTSSVRFTITAASIRCLDQWVSPKELVKIQHYAEREMLDIEHYPDIEFHSTRITPESSTRFHVQGLLAIRSVPKPAVIDVTLQSYGGQIDWAEGQAFVKLTDYGLKPATAALGAIGTSNEMKLTFRVKLTASRDSRIEKTNGADHDRIEKAGTKRLYARYGRPANRGYWLSSIASIHPVAAWGKQAGRPL